MRARSAAALGTAAAVGSSAIGALELASCVSEPSIEELAAQSVVITQVVPGTDFTAFETFAIDDSIEVTRDLGEGNVSVVPVDPAIAAPTLEAITRALTDRGYRRVDRAAQPDLGVPVTAVVRLDVRVPYGAWWGAGATNGGYWGVGGSPATGITSTGIAAWQEGVLVIELYDLRAARAAAPTATAAPDGGQAAPIPVVWAAFIYGVLAVDASLPAPPIEGVQQAFAQSPYLTAR